ATPCAIGGGSGPEIDRHVKNRTPCAAHQFSLERRRYLQMQSSNRPLLPAELHVRLDGQKANSLFVELPRAPSPHKAATTIVVLAGIDDPGARHSGLDKIHRRYSPQHGNFCCGRPTVPWLV